MNTVSKIGVSVNVVYILLILLVSVRYLVVLKNPIYMHIPVKYLFLMVIPFSYGIFASIYDDLKVVIPSFVLYLFVFLYSIAFYGRKFAILNVFFMSGYLLGMVIVLGYRIKELA